MGMLNSTSQNFNLLTVLPSMQPPNNSQPTGAPMSGAGAPNGEKHTLQPLLAPNPLQESGLTKIAVTNPPLSDSSAPNHEAFLPPVVNALALAESNPLFKICSTLEGSEKDNNFDYSWAKKVLEDFNFKMTEKKVERIFKDEEEEDSYYKVQESPSLTHSDPKRQKMSSDNTLEKVHEYVRIPRCFENGDFDMLKCGSASSQLLKTALDLCTSSYNFLVVKKSAGLTISFCSCKDSHMKLSKAHFTLEGFSPAVVANFIMSKDREDEIGHEVLERSKNYRTIRRHLRMIPYFIMKREIVAFETWTKIGKEHYLAAGQSVNIPSLPKSKDTVTADCDVRAYLVEPYHNGTVVTFVSRTDLNGSVPAALVNTLLGVQMSSMTGVWHAKLAKLGAMEDYFECHDNSGLELPPNNTMPIV